MADIAALNTRYGIPGIAEVVAGNGGLAAVRVTAPQASGMVYLHGGHVAAWQPTGFDEVLWLSGKSLWQEGKAIRGGVPICFPWFGPRKDDATAPIHGFARLKEWTLESVKQTPYGVAVVLALKADEETKKIWPHAFTLKHTVTFGAKLTMKLELANTGVSPLTAEEAQHTYFGLGDVRQVKLDGLEGVKYYDKANGMKEVVQDGKVVITAETDRVYVETTTPVIIEDGVKHRHVTLEKEGSRTTVVWNPWVAKAKAMADFGDEEWPGMICVETCNVLGHAVTVQPGHSHAMTSVMSVAAL